MSIIRSIGQSHANAPLSKHLFIQLDWRFVPFLALGTPPLVNPMVRDLDRRGRRHIDHLSQPRQCDSSEPQMAVGTRHESMFHYPRGRRSWTATIVHGFAL